MRRLALLAVMVLTSTLMARQPNVIIIFTDDQGTIDMNVYGATDLATPHMDGLARRGVRFTQFYAAAPVCSPSRVGLMTGRTPQHGGLSGNVGLDAVGMPSAQVTIAEELKKAGYATAHIGKWHLGHSEQTIPNGQGFDHSFRHLVGCIDNYSHFFYWKSGKSWAVREGKWKLIVTGDMTELYDIPNDLGEARNLATQYPEVVTHLKKASQAYWKSIAVNK